MKKALKQGVRNMLGFIGRLMNAAVQALEASYARAMTEQEESQQRMRLVQRQIQQADLESRQYNAMMEIAREIYIAMSHARYGGAIEVRNAAALRIRGCRPEPPYWAFYFSIEKPSNFRLGNGDLAHIARLINEDIHRAKASLIRQYGEQQTAVMYPYIYYGMDVKATTDTGYEVILRVITPLHMVESASNTALPGTDRQ